MGIKSALDAILEGQRNKVHVTLTYAQSLDGRIAGKDGTQLRLSGDESMLMTHWMRTRHDAILVGIGTALNDNPQLNGMLSLYSLLHYFLSNLKLVYFPNVKTDNLIPYRDRSSSTQIFVWSQIASC